MRRREEVPLRRLGEVPLRRRWVFHLRRTCDVIGTYRETSLQRHYDVLLPGGMVASLREQLQEYHYNGRLALEGNIVAVITQDSRVIDDKLKR